PGHAAGGRDPRRARARGQGGDAGEDAGRRNSPLPRVQPRSRRRVRRTCLQGGLEPPRVLVAVRIYFCKGGRVMVISVNGSPVTLDIDQILIWALVGLVAGFLASHVALGHGLCVFWYMIICIVGALFGGIVLAGFLHFSITIAGHPIISAMIMAFI